jgi:predicted metal-binding protein
MRVIWEKEVAAEEIIVSPRPVWKCRSCPAYGKSPSCPPHAPSWREARELVQHYKRALLIKFSINSENFDEEKRKVLNYILKREEELFKGGNFYATALFPGNCNLCEECEFEKSGSCKMPSKVRPSIDAVGIELSKIVKLNFSESVLYGLILID